MKKLLIIIFILVLSGCGNVGERVLNDSTATVLIREIDREAGVVCWRFKGRQGIDCMLINETNLGQGK